MTSTVYIWRCCGEWGWTWFYLFPYFDANKWLHFYKVMAFAALPAQFAEYPATEIVTFVNFTQWTCNYLELQRVIIIIKVKREGVLSSYHDTWLVMNECSPPCPATPPLQVPDLPDISVLQVIPRPEQGQHGVKGQPLSCDSGLHPWLCLQYASLRNHRRSKEESFPRVCPFNWSHSPSSSNPRASNGISLL